LKTNFPGCGRGDRKIVRGTTATSDEPTGNFGSALENILIGDFRLVSLFAEKTLQAILEFCNAIGERADIEHSLLEVSLWTHGGHLAAA
jgi:hypothetical protein